MDRDDRSREYTPQIISRWLDNWAALDALAEGVGALTLRLTPYSSRHLFADVVRWPVVQADIQAALAHLQPSRAFDLITTMIFAWHECEQGDFGDRTGDWHNYLVVDSGAQLRPPLDPDAAHQVYWNGVRLMARHLGWRPADE